MKSHVSLHVRIEKDEHDKLSSLAESLNLPISYLVRSGALIYGESLVLNREQILRKTRQLEEVA